MFRCWIPAGRPKDALQGGGGPEAGADPFRPRAFIASLDDPDASGAPVELTTPPDNRSSRHVIEANGRRLVERFEKLPAYGGGEARRFRIDL